LRPDSSDTRSELNRLYRAEEMWPDLLDNLRLEASTEQNYERRVALRKEVGHILAEKLESHEEAVEADRLGLGEAPSAVATLDAVRSLGEQHEHLRSLAAEVLVPVLRQTGSSERLVDTLEMRLSVESEPTERAETLRTIAQVQESELSDVQSALGTLLRALGERPDAADLHGDIERRAPQAGDFASHVAAP